MFSKKTILIVSLLFLLYPGYSQKVNGYTINESKNAELFGSFINFLRTNTENQTDITDSSRLKYMLVHYLFVDKKIDTSDNLQLISNELSDEQLINLQSQVKAFYRFLQENKIPYQNLKTTPLRLSSDKFIYIRMTPFQRENTFVFYNKLYPKKTLGYILFLPRIKNLVAEPRIWSWTLMFKFGKFIFKSITGEEGNEYLFGNN